MTAPNNMDWGALLGKLLGTARSDENILRQLETVDPQIEQVVAAAMAVYSELGHGYVVGVYRDALAIECGERDIVFERNVPVHVRYKGHDLDTGFAADFVCHNDLLVIVKTVDVLDKPDDLELINHLKATGYRRGLTLNFGLHRMDFRRIVGPAPAAGAAGD